MKKSVLLLVANLQQGGQEKVAVNTAKILKDRYNVILAVFDGSNIAYETNSDIIDFNIPPKSGKFAKAINVVRRVIKLNRVIVDKKVDIVYSFGITANLVNALSTPKKKTIISIHGYRAAKINKIMGKIYGRADVVIGVSKVICERIAESNMHLNGKLQTLYNPYDIDEILFKGDEMLDDFDFSHPTIVSSGRLNEVKNFPRLIKAFSILNSKMPETRLLILGEGEERSTLESLIEKYGLCEKVTLAGFKSNPFAYLSKSTLYVLSSYNEGFPNSLIEGMCFIPVVSADCKSGPREILTDGPIDIVTNNVEYAPYGILVRPAVDTEVHDEITDDDRIMASAMIEIICNEMKYNELKKAAIERVKKYSMVEYYEKLKKIIEQNED